MEIFTGKRLKSRREKIGKSYFTPGKNWEKWLCPPEKFPCYATDGSTHPVLETRSIDALLMSTRRGPTNHKNWNMVMLVQLGIASVNDPWWQHTHPVLETRSIDALLMSTRRGPTNHKNWNMIMLVQLGIPSCQRSMVGVMLIFYIQWFVLAAQILTWRSGHKMIQRRKEKERFISILYVNQERSHPSKIKERVGIFILRFTASLYWIFHFPRQIQKWDTSLFTTTNMHTKHQNSFKILMSHIFWLNEKFRKIDVGEKDLESSSY